VTCSTTIKIRHDDLAWWKDCCRKLKLNSVDAFSRLKRAVQLKQQNSFFMSLKMPSNYKKPLCGKSIQKTGTSYK